MSRPPTPRCERIVTFAVRVRSDSPEQIDAWARYIAWDLKDREFGELDVISARVTGNTAPRRRARPVKPE